VRAAASTSRISSTTAGPPTLAKIANRRRPGTTSRKSSSRLAARSVCCIDRPVTLPPGRARLATRPVPTGSPAAIEGYVVLEVVEANLGDYRERQAVAGTIYRAFTDPSGGSEDSWTLAISHRDRENDLVVIDATRERVPPFSPEQVVADYAACLATYGITRVTGDRYAGEFPRELFRKYNITYELAKQPKSELFRDFLPLLNSKRVVLPRNDKLVAQICGLERDWPRTPRTANLPSLSRVDHLS
jgi:hypothetical protein